MRSSVRATSMPPLSVKTPRSLYWRTLSSVSAVISLEWSTGKMKFEAWPVDPPGFGNGPLSSSTRSLQPCCAQVMGHAVSDDPGADHNGAGASGQRAHAISSPVRRALGLPRSVPSGRQLIYQRAFTVCKNVPQPIPAGATGLLSDRAYAALRDRLISLAIPPGAPIDEDALTRELGVGRTPVREAVRRLALEGLVVVYPRRGTFASSIDITSLTDITDVRCQLEPHAAARAATARRRGRPARGRRADVRARRRRGRARSR